MYTERNGRASAHALEVKKSELKKSVPTDKDKMQSSAECLTEFLGFDNASNTWQHNQIFNFQSPLDLYYTEKRDTGSRSDE
jgi:hypothetical protein